MRADGSDFRVLGPNCVTNVSLARGLSLSPTAAGLKRRTRCGSGWGYQWPCHLGVFPSGAWPYACLDMAGKF
jgi:hypothetical protein